MFTNVVTPPADIIVGVLTICFRLFGKELVGAGLCETKEA